MHHYFQTHSYKFLLLIHNQEKNGLFYILHELGPNLPLRISLSNDADHCIEDGTSEDTQLHAEGNIGLSFFQLFQLTHKAGLPLSFLETSET